jgi:hypothetical protein
MGTVKTRYPEGLVSSTVDENWPTDGAYEYVYTPDGAATGFCVATGSVGGPLVLQQCASSASTIWIAMSNDNIGGYEPLMTAANTIVNTPYVMTMTGMYSAVTTSELTLTQGTFSPDQMIRDINGEI